MLYWHVALRFVLYWHVVLTCCLMYLHVKLYDPFEIYWCIYMLSCIRRAAEARLSRLCTLKKESWASSPQLWPLGAWAVWLPICLLLWMCCPRGARNPFRLFTRSWKTPYSPGLRIYKVSVQLAWLDRNNGPAEYTLYWQVLVWSCINRKVSK